MKLHSTFKNRTILKNLKNRNFSSAAAAAAPAPATSSSVGKYNVVKFEAEDPNIVASEVPDFSYYKLPDKDFIAGLEKYKNATLTETLLPGVEEKLVSKPEYKYSKLENGLRIATIDHGEERASIGLSCHVGSRYDGLDTPGMTHMVELMAYKSTAHISQLRIGKTFEVMGVEADCSVGRENITYRANFLRDSLPYVMPLLVGNVLYPRLIRWEVMSSHSKVETHLSVFNNNTLEYVNELIHQQAWFNNTLGLPLYVEGNQCLSYFTEQHIRQHMLNHFSPNRCTLVGVNVNHEDFCKWAMRSYVDYNPIPYKERTESKSVYTGGYNYQKADKADVTVAIGFELPGGWSSADNIALSVYETILGGCVAGEETDGNHLYTSKLVQDVVLASPAVGSCSAFSNMYSDSGIWGVIASITPDAAPEYITHISKVLASPVSPDELKRGKAGLKRAAVESVNKDYDCADDMSKQMLMSENATVLNSSEIAAKIDAVTPEQISKIQALVSTTKPTVIAYGNTSFMPLYDDVCSTLSKPSAPKISAPKAAAAKPKK